MSARILSLAAQVSGSSPIGWGPAATISNGGRQQPQLLDGTQTLAATFYTVPIDVRMIDFYRFSFVCPSTGTPVGTVQLQGTTDDVPGVSDGPNANDQPAGNWLALSFSVNGAAYANSFAVSSATSIALDELRCNYAWVRMLYTLSSGTVAPTVKFMLKGIMGR